MIHLQDDAGQVRQVVHSGHSQRCGLQWLVFPHVLDWVLVLQHLGATVVNLVIKHLTFLNMLTGVEECKVWTVL